MRVLLDECVTRYAAGEYDALITVDQNLRYQQNLETLPVPVTVLSARRSTYPMLKPLMPRVLEALERLDAGQVVVIKQ
jgi:hypothetical protein